MRRPRRRCRPAGAAEGYLAWSCRRRLRADDDGVGVVHVGVEPVPVEVQLAAVTFTAVAQPAGADGATELRLGLAGVCRSLGEVEPDLRPGGGLGSCHG